MQNTNNENKIKMRTSHYLKMQTLDQTCQCHKNKRCSFEQGCNNGSSLKVPRPNVSANIGTTYKCKCNTYKKYSLTTQLRKVIKTLSTCKRKKRNKKKKNHITQK
jgi:hypothetical protein